MKVTICDIIMVFIMGVAIIAAGEFIYNLIYPPVSSQVAIVGAVSGTGSTSLIIAILMIISMFAGLYCLYKEPCVGREKP